MADVLAPELHLRWHPSSCEQAGQRVVAGQQCIFPGALADRGVDVGVAIAVQPRVVIGQVSQQPQRRVVGHERVLGITEEVAGVIDAAEGDEGVEQVGASKKADGGMHSTHGVAGGDQGFGPSGLFPDESDDLLGDVAVVALLQPGPMPWVLVGRRPRLGVDGVDAEQAQLPGGQPGAQGLDHAEVGVVAEPARQAREHDGGLAGVTMDVE